MPLLVTRWEPELVEMADNARHGDGAVTPWWAEVEIKIVILYVRATDNVSLSDSSARSLYE